MGLSLTTANCGIRTSTGTDLLTAKRAAKIVTTRPVSMLFVDLLEAKASWTRAAILTSV